MDQTKTQGDRIPTATDAPAGAIISADTHRENRIPPGQSRTRKWPVLDASGAPPVDRGKWTLELRGLVERPLRLDWETFGQLPRVCVFADLHCVTRWSRFGNLWEGVSVNELVERAAG